VDASFSSTDATGCVATEVFVSANSGTEQDLPNTTRYSLASVQLYQYDSCTGATLRDASGLRYALTPGAFQVSRQLDQARLQTTIAVSDVVSGNTFDVIVDVVWSGTSQIIRSHSNTNEIYPGCHIINRWKGSGRDAIATGTVSSGSGNFTPAPSDGAEIGSVIEGFEIMGCA
jgi:hypothetical protein